MRPLRLLLTWPARLFNSVATAWFYRHNPIIFRRFVRRIFERVDMQHKEGV